MTIAGFERSHVLIAGTVLALGAMFAFRTPSTAIAASDANRVQPTPAQVVYVDQLGRPLPMAPIVPAASPAQLIPANYNVTPTPLTPVTLSEPRPVVRPVSVARSSSAPRVVRSSSSESRRSWAKTALVIGGSAGGGAGIGGLIGGKKGAAIGAALGGGSAALFEALKR